jgi:deoxycytidylate deaminase
MNDQRPSWPSVWMSLAETLSQRSCDPKTKVGAVIVSGDNTRVLSLGYNGSPHGFPNERESMLDGQGALLHAEQNCYYKLSYNEQCEKILYTLFSPCPDCARGAIQCKINRIVYKTLFRDVKGLEIIGRSNIELYTLEEAEFLSKCDAWGDNWDKTARYRCLDDYIPTGR